LTADLRLLALANRALARVPPVTLDPDEIERYVACKEEVSGWSERHWQPAFEQLCRDLEEKAALTPLGRIMANGQLVGLLRARCRAERLLARHPDILDQPLERPIIIMGPMRSGSTRLQRLLACDERLGWTRLYETLFPIPRGRGDRLRVAAAAGVHSTLRALNPAVQQIHPSGPLRPEEEFGFLSFAFHSGQFAVQWNVPDFLEAERRRELGPVARELATLLRINAWARRERARTPILKCPAYSGMAEAMLEVFPDARLICLSRDADKVVASSASLVVEQRRIHSDAVDPRQLGPEWLARTAERQRLLGQARRHHPEVPAFDLHYDGMSADWVGTMHRLYRFLGLPLDRPTLSAMQHYMEKASAHRGHRYDLADYGLDDASVRAAFQGTGTDGLCAYASPAVAAE
jgi:hypothetical protein